MKVDRQAVLVAAARLLAANPGATTQEIAAAAAISRATLHRLFPTRDALIEELGILVVARVRAAFAAARLDEGPLPAAIARLTEACLPIVHEFAFLASERQLNESPVIAASGRDIDADFERVLLRGQEEGALRLDLPATWLGFAFEGLLLAAAEATRRGAIAPRDASRLVVSSFLAGAARGPVAVSGIVSTRPSPPDEPTEQEV